MLTLLALMACQVDDRSLDTEDTTASDTEDTEVTSAWRSHDGPPGGHAYPLLDSLGSNVAWFWTEDEELAKLGRHDGTGFVELVTPGTPQLYTALDDTVFVVIDEQLQVTTDEGATWAVASLPVTGLSIYRLMAEGDTLVVQAKGASENWLLLRHRDGSWEQLQLPSTAMWLSRDGNLAHAVSWSSPTELCTTALDDLDWSCSEPELTANSEVSELADGWVATTSGVLSVSTDGVVFEEVEDAPVQVLMQGHWEGLQLLHQQESNRLYTIDGSGNIEEIDTPLRRAGETARVSVLDDGRIFMGGSDYGIAREVDGSWTDLMNTPRDIGHVYADETGLWLADGRLWHSEGDDDWDSHVWENPGWGVYVGEELVLDSANATQALRHDGTLLLAATHDGL